MTRRDQLFLLGGLAAVWVGVAAVQLGAYTEPKRVPLVNTGKAGQAAATIVDGEWHVTLWKKSVSHSPARPSRNLFDSLREGNKTGRSPGPTPRASAKQALVQLHSPILPLAPVAVVAPKVEPSVPRLSPEVLAANEAARTEAQRAKQVREDLAQYRVIGFTERGGLQQAIIGKGADIYIVQLGDTVEGRFQVTLVESSRVALREPRSRIDRLILLEGLPGGRS